MRTLTAIVLLLLAGPALAQIEDNSFLLEEAYNQKEREVQHILTFERSIGEDDWQLAIEQEWPLGSQAHQLSYELPLLSVLAPDGKRVTGFGDAMFSYRYQALGVDGGNVALAPRATLILPTGDDEENLGNGTLGYEVGLPLSLRLGEAIAAHTNASLTYYPSAIEPINEDIVALNLGQSLIWLVSDNFNVMLEGMYGKSWFGGDDMGDAFILSPGIRWAHDFDGLQIVPGIAIPTHIGELGEDGAMQLFLYLSLEHDF